MTTTKQAPPRVIALVATIPARKRSCERLLTEIGKQSRRPDGVVLVLDGYDDGEQSSACPLPIIFEQRTKNARGAGNRWRVVCELQTAVDGEPALLAADDIIVCLDDDVMLVAAPMLVRALVTAVEKGGGAAAAMGRSADGKFSPPSSCSRGDLLHGLGCGLAMRAKHLIGLQAFADEVKAAGGPDALGLLGDDDALVSAFLWKTGVRIAHAATGNIFAAPGTNATSARRSQKEHPDAQKLEIKRITGWPWYVHPAMAVRKVAGTVRR